MTVPTWPAELPQFMLQDGFGKTLADGRLKTPMDAGPPKVRRRFSSAVTPVAGQIQVTGDEVARFERFWDEDTVGGALPFLIPDQLRDGRPMLTEEGEPVLDDDDQPVLVSAWWLAAFDDAPSVVRVLSYDLYIISFQLNVLP